MWTQASPIAPSRRSVAAFIALALAGVATSPAAAVTADSGTSRGAQSGGISYVAETKGGHVALMLSRDGRQVTRAFAAFTYSCSDGTTFTDFDGFKRVPLRANGTFSSEFDTGAFPSELLPGVTVQFAGTIDGRRNKTRTKIAGTVRFTIVTTVVATKAIVTCDTGTIRYTAKD
jgi:hypothetical protein